MFIHQAIKQKEKQTMPAAILETVDATWNRPRSAEEISDFLGRRHEAFALAEASATAEEAAALAELDDVE
jgi:hypothetical protein